MIIKIKPGKAEGIIHAPASKSSMQRGCAAALLHKGTTIIDNPGKSNDDLAALEVIKNLGAIVKEQADGSLLIESNGVQPVSNELNCGESGLGIRMFTPIAALSEKEITINGRGSLVTRPMDFFDEIFPQLDISIQTSNGKLPLKIKGPLQPKDITVDGSLSSQFLTGLLMAFGKAVTKPAIITVINLKSRPYIDLTLQVMKYFGYNVVNDNHYSFTILPMRPTCKQINYTVEGDWSGGAFLLVAGAVSGNIIVKGLDVHSTQADKKILEALKDCGCYLSIDKNEITIATASGMKAFEFDATDCPDLFPPLVALAAYCKGTTTIKGVSRLAHKESNRGLTLQEEFGKMGVVIQLQDDLMLIDGNNAVKGATVYSHHDHRIAMACAVAALGANGETVIEEAGAINKSYPVFYEHLQQLGGTINQLETTLK